MGVITHRPLDELDPTAPLGEFIDPEHLMHIIARSTIWGGDQHTVHRGHGHPIPESIQTGALERGTTIPVIAVNVLVGHSPLGVRRHVLAETTELLFNRLVLWLTRRGNSGVESNFHGAPPADAMGQAGCLRRVP
jgi:hypothetical protein